MFNKNKLANILNKINDTYSNMSEFAKQTNCDRSYISKYIHKKLDNPPTPKVLAGFANASKGIITYEELMNICGYTSYMTDFFFNDDVKQRDNKIPIVYEINFDEEKNKFIIISDNKYISINFVIEDNKEYFAYRAKNDDMLPLLGTNDIAIIEKTSNFKNGETCLICLDNKTILIRKIIDLKDSIELQVPYPYIKPITLTNEDIKLRNFKILGKVIRAENSSAFK